MGLAAPCQSQAAGPSARTSLFGVLTIPTMYFPLLILTLLVLLGAHPLETTAAVGVSALPSPALASHSIARCVFIMLVGPANTNAPWHRIASFEKLRRFSLQA